MLVMEADLIRLRSETDEDGQYLRVTLDKAENFKVAAGIRLKDILENRFGGDRNALELWYKANVETWGGEFHQHRAWSTVVRFLGTVQRVVQEFPAASPTTIERIVGERIEQRREYQTTAERRARGTRVPSIQPNPVERDPLAPIQAMIAALSTPDFERFKVWFRNYCGGER